MSHPLAHPPVVPSPTIGARMRDRLPEARGVLADAPQHPDSLVILAARVVAWQTSDAHECGEALEVLRLLGRRQLHVVAAAAFTKGGGA